MTIIKLFTAPALPTATRQYDEQATNQVSKILRIYFNQLDSLLTGLTNTLNNNLIAGSTTQVQYNNAGAFAASSNFTYDAGTNTVSFGNITGTALGMTIQPRAPTVLENPGALNLLSLDAIKPNTTGGDITLLCGNGVGTGAGGTLRMDAGQGGATGTGGVFLLASGSGVDGGDFNMIAGSSSTTTGNGGNFNAVAGSGLYGGGLNFGAGNNTITGGTAGSVFFNAGLAVVGSQGGDIVFTTVGSGNAADYQGSHLLTVLGGTVTGLQVTDNAVAAQIGFYGVTPVVRPTTAGAAATRVAVASTNIQTSDTFDGYTVAQVVKALRNLGILT